MSRADLARSIQTSKPTISTVVRTLLSDGFLQEQGTRATRATGRPGALLELDRDQYCVAAIRIASGEKTQMALFDLHGSAITDPVVLGEDTSQSMTTELLRELRSSSRDLVGIALGLEGSSDPSATLGRTFNVPTSSAPLIAALALREHKSTASDRSILLTLGDTVQSCVVTCCGPDLIAIAGDLGSVRDEGARDRELAPAIEAIRLAIQDQASSPKDRALLRTEAGLRLGAAVAPLAATLDLVSIGVSGWPGLLRDDFISALSQTVAQGCRKSSNRLVRVVAQSPRSALASIAALMKPRYWVAEPRVPVP